MRDRRRPARLVYLAPVLLWLPATCSQAGPEPAGKVLRGAGDMTPGAPALTISRGQSPWRGYTGSAAEEAAGLHVAPAVLAPGWESPAHLAAYLPGQPLLAIDRASRRVHLDARYFGPLTRVDVPRLAPGQTALLGTLVALPPGLTPAALVRFALEAQLLITYWHLEAELRLVAEHEDEARYEATWAGFHRYCTNQCIDDPLRFSVTFDKRTRALSVTAREP